MLIQEYYHVILTVAHAQTLMNLGLIVHELDPEARVNLPEAFNPNNNYHQNLNELEVIFQQRFKRLDNVAIETLIPLNRFNLGSMSWHDQDAFNENQAVISSPRGAGTWRYSFLYQTDNGDQVINANGNKVNNVLFHVSGNNSYIGRTPGRFGANLNVNLGDYDVIQDRMNSVKEHMAFPME